MHDEQDEGQVTTVRARQQVLETAILGLLHDAPMHGYELRKHLNLVLGSFRALSYGSLYPCLRGLVSRGWIEGTETMDGPAVSTRRARIVYALTPAGKEHLQAELATSGPASWEDEHFDVRFAFFGQTDAETRLRILEGRRSRLTERLDTVRQGLDRARGRVDEYTLELQRHGLDLVEREVRWLDELIAHERGSTTHPTTGGGRPADPGPTDAMRAVRQDRPVVDPGRTTQKERG